MDTAEIDNNDMHEANDPGESLDKSSSDEDETFEEQRGQNQKPWTWSHQTDIADSSEDATSVFYGEYEEKHICENCFKDTSIPEAVFELQFVCLDIFS